MGMGGFLLLGLSLISQAKAPARIETAADVVTLRDGSMVLGQVVESAARGTLTMLVRREWASANLPEANKRWRTAEQPTLRRALSQRKERLNAWRRERADVVPPSDPTLHWIDREIERLSKPEAEAHSVLMVVKLNRAGVVSIVRRPKANGRMLRQGWLSRFANVEAMPLDSLQDALEARGFLTQGKNEVSIDRLLPIPGETETQWLARRAATEVINDTGLRFLQTQGLVLPEGTPGQAAALDAAGSAIQQLQSLLSDDRTPSDPLADRLREIASRGRAGALVTRLEISPDLSAVRVEAVLLARDRQARWMPVVTRSNSVRPETLEANAGQDLEQDPQVSTVFKVVESLGLGQVPEEVKQRSLKMGAATQKALGQTRTAFLKDLAALAFPVGDVPPEEPKIPPRP